MKGRRMLFGVLAVGLGLATLAAGLALAQEPGPPSEVSIQAAPGGTAASAPPVLSPVEGLSTGFTYQGRLTDGGIPADGNYDFEFKLYDAASAGSLLGTVIKEDVIVTDGLFTVQLDFGSGVFTGDARWLEIGVRPGASMGPYTTLTPRQALTATPYALALPGLWTQPNVTSPNLIGGHNANWITDGVVGATIGGGGAADDGWGNPVLNRVTDDFGAVGGGWDNQAGDADADTADAIHSTVGGGSSNIASGRAATVGGGSENEASGGVATVSGGHHNMASEDYATIGGGVDNAASGAYATIGGGNHNVAEGAYGTVGGGLANSADGEAATVGGGYNNLAQGDSATVGGGKSNQAMADYATIAGGGRSDPTDFTTGNRVTDNYGTVGGGGNNQAGDADADPTDATYATVGGGKGNLATAWSATVSGGADNAASGDASAVGGGVLNVASGWYAAVGGGTGNLSRGNYAVIGGGSFNVVDGEYATASGGKNNTTLADYGTVGGGVSNRATGLSTTVGGGANNTANGDRATVGGGADNDASGSAATISGGTSNTASGWTATIGGGHDNEASGGAATIGGGTSNTASGWAATVGGGGSNIASGGAATIGGGTSNTASGWAATVSGGYYSAANGDFSFAAGRRARANNQGCFVWGDSTDADVACNTDNRWVARASGGVYFYTNSDLTSGVYVPAGGNAWSSVSDRNRKENFEPVDTQALLARLSEIPITTWNYKSQDPSIRHIGPMAQDFYAAFGLGEDELHISTVDADGVALAAIQGLYELSQEQAARIRELEKENAALQQQLDDLETRVAALEKTMTVNSAPTLPIGWLLFGGLSLAGLVVGQRWRPGGGQP